MSSNPSSRVEDDSKLRQYMTRSRQGNPSSSPQPTSSTSTSSISSSNGIGLQTTSTRGNSNSGYISMTTSKLGSSWTYYKARLMGTLSVHLMSHMLYPTANMTSEMIAEKAALRHLYQERKLDAVMEDKRRKNAVRQL